MCIRDSFNAAARATYRPSSDSPRTRSFLLRQLGPERALPVGHVRLVTGRIDERVPFSIAQTPILGSEIEVAPVRAEENVHGQGIEHAKRLLEIIGDLRVGRVVYESVA